MYNCTSWYHFVINDNFSQNLSDVQTGIFIAFYVHSHTKFIYKRRYIPHPSLINPLSSLIVHKYKKKKNGFINPSLYMFVFSCVWRRPTPAAPRTGSTSGTSPPPGRRRPRRASTATATTSLASLCASRQGSDFRWWEKNAGI